MSAPLATRGGKWPAGSRLYVSNLNVDRNTHDDLFKIFSRHGRLVEEVLVRKNFAFIQFDNVGAAEAAIRAEKGRVLAGNRIEVVLATEDRPRRGDARSETRTESRPDARAGFRDRRRSPERARSPEPRRRPRSPSPPRDRDGRGFKRAVAPEGPPSFREPDARPMPRNLMHIVYLHETVRGFANRLSDIVSREFRNIVVEAFLVEGKASHEILRRADEKEVRYLAMLSRRNDSDQTVSLFIFRPRGRPEETNDISIQETIAIMRREENFILEAHAQEFNQPPGHAPAAPFPADVMSVLSGPGSDIGAVLNALTARQGPGGPGGDPQSQLQAVLAGLVSQPPPPPSGPHFGQAPPPPQPTSALAALSQLLNLPPPQPQQPPPMAPIPQPLPVLQQPAFPPQQAFQHTVPQPPPQQPLAALQQFAQPQRPVQLHQQAQLPPQAPPQQPQMQLQAPVQQMPPPQQQPPAQPQQQPSTQQPAQLFSADTLGSLLQIVTSLVQQKSTGASTATPQQQVQQPQQPQQQIQQPQPQQQQVQQPQQMQQPQQQIQQPPQPAAFNEQPRLQAPPASGQGSSQPGNVPPRPAQPPQQQPALRGIATSRIPPGPSAPGSAQPPRPQEQRQQQSQFSQSPQQSAPGFQSAAAGQYQPAAAQSSQQGYQAPVKGNAPLSVPGLQSFSPAAQAQFGQQATQYGQQQSSQPSYAQQQQQPQYAQETYGSASQSQPQYSQYGAAPQSTGYSQASAPQVSGHQQSMGQTLDSGSYSQSDQSGGGSYESYSSSSGSVPSTQYGQYQQNDYASTGSSPTQSSSTQQYGQQYSQPAPGYSNYGGQQDSYRGASGSH
eukprot:TRINITY_DN1828_c0_g1_i10.p1 TRINITY_DN1828_c0_g1~~TRINITY_DN1828_c0_g1_i10.p1  ORF type:complete len:837 (+),score=112.98 TRINITY_DN1828_c0_g1_i10:59-2569(+)